MITPGTWIGILIGRALGDWIIKDGPQHVLTVMRSRPDGSVRCHLCLKPEHPPAGPDTIAVKYMVPPCTCSCHA